MLQHILKKKNLLISIALRSRPRLPPRLPRRGRHPLPKTTYGRPPVTGGCFLHMQIFPATFRLSRCTDFSRHVRQKVDAKT
eukprot:scaffold58684_cov45-Phaeocystis_antarctica.AAC.1